MAIANYSILLPLIKQKQERYLYTTVLKKMQKTVNSTERLKRSKTIELMQEA